MDNKDNDIHVLEQKIKEITQYMNSANNDASNFAN